MRFSQLLKIVSFIDGFFRLRIVYHNYLSFHNCIICNTETHQKITVQSTYSQKQLWTTFYCVWTTYWVIFSWNIRKLVPLPLHKKWSFPLRISSVNATKSVVSCGFCHSYWRNPYWKTSFFCAVAEAFYTFAS